MKRGWTKWILLSSTVGGLMAVVADGHAVVAQEKGGGDVTGRSGNVENWPLPVDTDGMDLGLDSCRVGRVGRSRACLCAGRSWRCEAPARGDIEGGRSAYWKVSAPR